MFPIAPSSNTSSDRFGNGEPERSARHDRRRDRYRVACMCKIGLSSATCELVHVHVHQTSRHAWEDALVDRYVPVKLDLLGPCTYSSAGGSCLLSPFSSFPHARTSHNPGGTGAAGESCKSDHPGKKGGACAPEMVQVIDACYAPCMMHDASCRSAPVNAGWWGPWLAYGIILGGK